MSVFRGVSVCPCSVGYVLLCEVINAQMVDIGQ